MGRYSDSGTTVGVGAGSQTSMSQSVYADAVNSIESGIAKQVEREALIQELERNGIKFTKEAVVFILRDQTGQIVWLERGNSGAGLEHIAQRHAKDFESKFGISKSEIPNFIQQVVRSGTMVSNTTSVRNGRETVQKIYEYQGERYLLIGQGSNGFIVTAYPVKKPKGQ